MASAAEDHKDYHHCDFCGYNFTCTTGFETKIGAMCHCLQEVVSDKETNYEKTRLAFWCCEECFDEDNPQDDSEEDESEEDPPTEDDAPPQELPIPTLRRSEPAAATGTTSPFITHLQNMLHQGGKAQKQ